MLLAIGLLWGTSLLVQLLAFVITGGRDASLLAQFAHLSNSLTLAPVCFLAFWRRRMACVWLVFNGLLVAVSVIDAALRTHQYPLEPIATAAIPVLLAVCLVTMEMRRWPGALERIEA